MKNRRFKIALTAVSAFVCLYLIQIWGESILLNPTGKGMALGNWLYPSLSVRLKTIGIAEVEQVLGQVKWRWLALCLVGIYFFQFIPKTSEGQPSLNRTRLMVQLLILVHLLYIPDLYKELMFRYQWRAFYEPIHFWGSLIPSYPGIWFFVGAVFLLVVSSCVLFMRLRDNARWLSIWSVLIPGIWTTLLASFFGFGKIDHTYASMVAGLWMLPALVWCIQTKGHLGFVIQVFQAFIWGCYFFAGLEKLFLSGLDWLKPTHFQTLALLHPSESGRWLIQFPTAVFFLFGCGLGFQLFSFLQWRWPKYGYVTLIAGLLFHLGTWLLFGIGGWQSPWILMLVFLWPGWNKNEAVVS